MVQRTSLQVVLLLFLTEYTSSRHQIEWFPDGKLPTRVDLFEHVSQAERQVVLDCSDVQFYLATRQDPHGSTKACLKQNSPIFSGRLNITKPTKILVHGWRNSRETTFTQNITEAYLTVEDVNVIQVDWSKDAELDYFTAVYRVPQVGYTLAKFILQMVQDLSLDVNNLNLIGFSLGAHVVGIAGYYTTPKVSQVIGLDPAGPLFESQGPTGKLTTESGQFVVTLHTCKYRLGTSQDLGHLNFNANSGMSQPGCWDSEGLDILGFCSHGRAPLIFAASLMYPKGFRATECSNYWEYELEMCDHHPTTYYTGNVDKSLRGIYFFDTTSAFPFTTITNDTSEAMLFVKPRSRGTEWFYRRESPQKESQRHSTPPKELKFRTPGKSHSAAKIIQTHPELIPKDKETAERMANLTRVLHQMLNMKDHVGPN